MTCDKCGDKTMRRLIIVGNELWCQPCRDEQRGESTHAAAVIGDDIPGGFVQENFGNKPETFYSKKAMAARAKELGLIPFVRHTDGDKHTKRWI